MPELPEIETVKNGIELFLINNKIKYSIVRNTKLRWPVSREILYLSNELILSVKRLAKYLIIQLQYGWIVIHLGMSGSIRILKKFQLPEKHDHIDLVLTSGEVLRYTDPRRFGAWLWTEELDNFPLFTHLGPDPLSNNFNPKYLEQQIKNKNIVIKSLLMNNKVVVGIGNIYVNEILFASKILPTRKSYSLTKKEINYLVIQIKQVLNSSIKLGGVTLKNFFQCNGKPGNFTHKLLIYGKKNEPCPCCTQLIKSIRLKQRSTYFCDNCQQ